MEKNTANLVKGVQKLTRRFTGKTEGFADKKERNFFDRMLKAYLKGDTRFCFGYEKDITGEVITGKEGKIRKWFNVQQEYFYI